MLRVVESYGGLTLTNWRARRRHTTNMQPLTGLARAPDRIYKHSTPNGVVGRCVLVECMNSMQPRRVDSPLRGCIDKLKVSSAVNDSRSSTHRQHNSEPSTPLHTPVCFEDEQAAMRPVLPTPSRIKFLTKHAVVPLEKEEASHHTAADVVGTTFAEMANIRRQREHAYHS